MPISIEGIKFGYTESREVLKDMNFTCRDNRITGIIGPNGCGKTTVLKVIEDSFILRRDASGTMTRSSEKCPR